MYWGTKRDNKLDDYLFGNHKTIYQSMVDKYGVDEATKMIKENASKGGKANRGKPKTEEHKRKIKEKLTS